MYTGQGTTKTKPCPVIGCGGVIFTDELHRAFNAKDDKGKIECPECKIRAIYAKYKS